MAILARMTTVTKITIPENDPRKKRMARILRRTQGVVVILSSAE